MKPLFENKIKAGALQLTIFIALIVAMLLAGLILYAYTFTYAKDQSKADIENIRLADSGITYLAANQVVSNDTINLPLAAMEGQYIKACLSQWGIFQKAFVICSYRKKRFTKIAILGTEMDRVTTPALFLETSRYPLALVGNTFIEGSAILPSSGIKSGYIAGDSFYGRQLIDGDIETSDKLLPRINKEYILYLSNYLGVLKPTNELEILRKDQIQESFSQPTKFIYSSQPITLENIVLQGNIIVKSEKTVTIKKTALLKDIIVVAPMIEVEDETYGNFQAIASNKISVGKKCKLAYPSALILVEGEKIADSRDGDTNVIFISEQSYIKGCVAYLKKDDKELKSSFPTHIILEKTARIKGEVYCQGNFELKGKVTGSVFTKGFITNHVGSAYVNHIYNGSITNKGLPIYGGVIFENSKKTVAKWLY